MFWVDFGGWIMFALIPVFLLHVISFISVYWSADIAAFMNYRKVGLDVASFVKVTPTSSHKGSKRIESIVRTEEEVYFIYQKRKYVWNAEKKQFEKVKYPTDLAYRDYLESRGLITKEVLEDSKRRYGRNVFDIPMPTFWDLYKEQALAPFFVFQVFCVALWCLDDYFYYSLFILFMLLIFEATTAKSRLNNVSIFRSMAIPETNLLVYRNKQWANMSSTELLPGDLAILRRTGDEQVVPCDMLILTGHCITNEAMLTGESTPQMKEPICSRSISDLDSGTLDINKDKLNIIFGGTKILQHSNPDNGSGNTIVDIASSLSQSKRSESEKSSTSAVADKSPLIVQDGCLCYVLRTGFQTGQGKLVRTILYSSERVTENNRESFLFIFILLLFALAASGYVLMEGLKDEARSRWKLMLNCTLIITSVVPPELPMQLSLAVTTSLLNLTREGVFCTEPFRIPYAGKVDYAAFDKTGTLTQEHLIMKGVALINDSLLSTLPLLESQYLSPGGVVSKTNGNGISIDSIASSSDAFIENAALDAVGYVRGDQLPDMTSFIMAGCHSLSVLDKEIIGDPIESAALKYAGWTLQSSEAARKQRSNIRIRHRFHFNSSLKRMSVIASVDANINLALVKGAPETLMDFLEVVPEHYMRCYKAFARRGARVIAMAYKNMPSLDAEGLRALKREEVESGLTFAGFLVFECPLKPDSKDVIQQLMDSSHETVMITGDAALTACEVSTRLKIVSKPILILETDKWVSVDESTVITYRSADSKELAKKWDFCIAGKALKSLLSDPSSSHHDTISLARVFARASPEDKTAILTLAKNMGKTTLMCGDGTNDVGALKQAHVGIALLVNSDDPRLKKLQHANPASMQAANGNQANSAAPSSTSPNIASSSNGASSSKPSGKSAAAAAIAAAAASSSNNSKKTASSLTPQKPAPKTFREALTQAQQALAEADEEGNKIVQLGDASIAAPFTSKGSSILPLLSILRQGRCTLVTTMQMFKILALNSLIYAYSLSVLYMDGIKYGDTQATIVALLSATCFLFISRSQPLTKLSKEKPVSKLFSLYMVISVIGQFAIHLASLMFIHQEASKLREGSKPDSESTFAPSIVNSAIFLLGASQQLSTFFVNYQGHPFMQSIRENRGFFVCLLITAAITVTSALQIVPEFNTSFDLVILPPQFAQTLVAVMGLDFLGAWVWEILAKVLLK
jgi:cation-transporting ATPase 13A1